MSSTLPYFDFSVKFYTTESTTNEDSGVLNTWQKCYEDAVYETFLESKSFNTRVERAEKLLRENSSKLTFLSI